jgi:hypothetical protein
MDVAAFASSGLLEMHIPASVRLVGDSCFENCGSFSFVGGLPTTSEGMFMLSGLKRLSVPNRVTCLAVRSFYSCRSIEDVVFDRE